MQAPASGKSLAEGQSFNLEAKGLHTLKQKVDDDGSTSAGSSDREHEWISSVPVSEPGRNDEPDSSALVYLLDMLSVTPEQQVSKTRLPKSVRKLQRLQRQQVNKKTTSAPWFDSDRATSRVATDARHLCAVTVHSTTRPCITL